MSFLGAQSMRWVAAVYLTCMPLGQVIAAPVSYIPILGITSSTAATDFWSANNLIQGPGVGFDAQAPYSRPDPLADGQQEWATDRFGRTSYPDDDYFKYGPTPVLTLDLGEDRLLTEISIWGYLYWTANGASAFTLRFASDSDGANGFGTSIDYNPVIAGLLNESYSRQSFALAPVTARFVQMTITDNFFDPAFPDGGGDRVGLGEIAFQAVPVPGTLALLGLGLAFLAAVRNRRA